MLFRWPGVLPQATPATARRRVRGSRHGRPTGRERKADPVDADMAEIEAILRKRGIT